MQFTKKLNIPGIHDFTFNTSVGSLEAQLVVPGGGMKNYNIAIIGHPHSLHGGNINNKVITTVVRVFRDLHLPSLRFNFRGVGRSQGAFDAGIGESEDCLHLARLWSNEFTQSQFFLVGFSFGSYVLYRTAAKLENRLLISIAPPVIHYNYMEFVRPHCWHIIHGDADAIINYNTVAEFAAKVSPPVVVHKVHEASHFFHGKLLELRAELHAIITKYL